MFIGAGPILKYKVNAASILPSNGRQPETVILVAELDFRLPVKKQPSLSLFFNSTTSLDFASKSIRIRGSSVNDSQLNVG